MHATGTVAVTNGGAGYAKGCIYIKTDVAAGTNGLYENIGTTAACNFNLVGSASDDTPRIATIQETFAFDDMTDNLNTTGQIDLTNKLPEGSVVVQSFVDAITGFAGDGTAVATIGDGTDVDRYNTGTVDVFTTSDHEDAGVPSGAVYQSAEETVRVTVTGGADFSSISAGEMTVTLFYYQSV